MGTVLQLGADSRHLRPGLSSWCTPSRGDITALYLHQLKGGTIHVLGGHVNRDFIPPLDKVTPCFSRSRRAATGTLWWHSVLWLSYRRCLGSVFLQLLSFLWGLFALIFSLLDFSIVALPENTFCRGLHPWLDGAFSRPTQPVLPMRATRLAQTC